MDMLGGSPEVRLLPDPGSVHLSGPISKRVLIVRRSNPRWFQPASCGGLNGGGQKRILSPVSAERAAGLKQAPSGRERADQYTTLALLDARRRLQP
jgi:hypothetical protein